MNKITTFFKQLGVWFYVAGSLLFFIATFFIDGPIGIALFVLGLILFLSDPIVYLYDTYIQKNEAEQGYLLTYAFGLVALISFWARYFFEIPATKMATDGGSILPRLRLALLFIFILSYIATIVARSMLSLSADHSKHTKGSGSSKRKTYLQSSLFSIIAVVTLLVGINYITTIRNPIIDFQGNLSFGENSTPVIASIKEEVKVHIFLPETQNVKTKGRTGTRELSRISEDIRVMLEQLPVINSNIKLEFLNADLASFGGNEFGTVNNGTIVVRKYKAEVKNSSDKPYVERKVYVYTQKDMKKLEREITRALVYVSAPKVTAYFTASNGERYNSNSTGSKGAGIDGLKDKLKFFNATLRGLDHNKKWPGPIPDDCQVLFIMGPTVPFGKDAKDSIKAYIKKGGDVFVAIDPAGKEKMDWLLNTTGGTYYKAESEFLFNTRLSAVALTDNTGTHRITDTFQGTKRPPVVLLKHSWFEKAKNKNPPKLMTPKQKNKDAKKPPVVFKSLVDLEATEILYSMHNSFTDRNRNTLPDKNEQIGRKAVALAYTQKENANAPKMVVFSGVDFLSDQTMNFPILNSNVQLAIDSLHWMTENPLVAGVVPEQGTTKTIQLTDEIKLRLIILGVLVFPLLMSGGLAILIAIYRRRRRFIGEV